MLDIIGIMGLFPKEYEEHILEKSIGGVQNAANNFQWGIVNGLDSIENVDLKLINSLYVGSYPKRYKEKNIPSFTFQCAKKTKGINVGFCNLTFYKIFSKYYGLKREIDKWAQTGELSNKIVIAYAMTSPFVELLQYIKNKYPYVLCILVVPDLPEFMNASASSKYLYKKLKNIQIKHFKKKLKNIDGYVLLTEAMKEWFDSEIKYVVVEGLLSKSLVELGERKHYNKENRILYSGMIEEKYGVVDLVENFMKIDNSRWKLDLYGNGSSLEKIKKISEQDKRVRIHGTVSNDFVREEQKKVEILVNPRNDNFEFTKYSFPSKVIEYMSSGTPMVGYKLSGMPEEYKKYFFEIPQSEHGMYETLKKTMEMTSEERKNKGEEALNFILRKKNAKVQCEKIVELINRIR